MSVLDLLSKSIRKESDQHTVDVRAQKIDLPHAFNNWREKLSFSLDTFYGIELPLLFDKGGTPASLRIAAKVSKYAIYIYDSFPTKPHHPHVDLQICRIMTDRFGRLSEVTLDVEKTEFFDYMRRLAPHSTVFERLAGIKLPHSFPEGPSIVEDLQLTWLSCIRKNLK
jgi:hypothetical protein